MKARASLPRGSDSKLDLDRWVADFTSRHPGLPGADLAAACRLVAGIEPADDNLLETGAELAELLAELRMDPQTLMAAIVYRPLRTGALQERTVAKALGDDVAGLAAAVVRMASTSLLDLSSSPMQTKEAQNQIENIRRMLVSLIDDARVAILKLAERIVALRHAKNGPAERRERIAREAHLIFVPLANRLGIWRLKWELEDLALRYLEPDVYMAIAKQLDGRREEREQQIAAIVALLERKLGARGVTATVTGRAKHIYSIYRKMRSKKVSLDEVYDVRGLRVLVPDIAQCYAALGVIHTEWQLIPTEFDDYIAAPKENGYRSIHTAVMGPDGKTLEVQIRTRDMHEESELGVCAHWAYKDVLSEDSRFTEKMNWLRQVVEAPEGERRSFRERLFASGENLRQALANRISEERIFVYTPKGHVLDLISSATAVDFAYRVHTEVGHACTAALVDGVPVALNVPLATGQRVEIVTAPGNGPDRRWLDAHLGFVHTARAREKIQAWFRERPEAERLRLGRTVLDGLLERSGLSRATDAALGAAAPRLGFRSARALLLGLAVGDCQVLDVLRALYPDRADGGRQLSLLPDATAGSGETFTIEIEAADREGLLRDVAMLLSEQHVSLIANTGRLDPERNVVLLSLKLRLPGVAELARIIDQLGQVPDVAAARRIDNELG